MDYATCLMAWPHDAWPKALRYFFEGAFLCTSTFREGFALAVPLIVMGPVAVMEPVAVRGPVTEIGPVALTGPLAMTDAFGLTDFAAVTSRMFGMLRNMNSTNKTTATQNVEA
jgi:hypothetical protein